MKEKKKNVLPPIKWTGSKRTQADRIITTFPEDINSYFELFLGSGSVLIKLLSEYPEKLVNCKEFYCTDTNPDLIAFHNLIKNNPDKLCAYYTERWTERNTYLGKLQPKVNTDEMVAHRNAHYYALRDKYNSHYFKGTEECAMELMTLLAFDFNGLVRYGKKGFNAPCMPVIPGMSPDNKKKIIDNCHSLYNKYDVKFECKSYNEIELNDNSTVYLDPPYKMFLNNKNEAGVYNSGNFNLESFYEWCNKSNVNYIGVSFDGGNVGDKAFSTNNGWKKIVNDTGISKFRCQMSKTKEPNKLVKTSESLYVKLNSIQNTNDTE